VIQLSSHEANVGPWVKLEEQTGVKIVWWEFEEGENNLQKETEVVPVGFSYETLKNLCNSNTKLVAVTHVSNLLGEIMNVKEITSIAHAVGAKVVVDGVAFAPHRSVDVKALNCDWYCFSHYKVYGPHVASLFGTHEAIKELQGLNHFFVPDDAGPYKWELGCTSHEGLAGVLALKKYINVVLRRSPNSPVDREATEKAFEIFEKMEAEPQAMLIKYLSGKKGVHLFGANSSSTQERVSTFSFFTPSMNSEAVVAECHKKGVLCRNGHMYCKRLVDKVPLLDPEIGVVRVSLVHYNTEKEVQTLIDCLEEIL
jgi:selenocysteine lyase/cysteine desulfurase